MERDSRSITRKDALKRIQRQKNAGRKPIITVEHRPSPEELARKRLTDIQELLKDTENIPDNQAELEAERVWLKFRLNDITDKERNAQLNDLLTGSSAKGYERLVENIGINKEGNPVPLLYLIRVRALSSDPTKGIDLEQLKQY